MFRVVQLAGAVPASRTAKRPTSDTVDGNFFALGCSSISATFSSVRELYRLLMLGPRPASAPPPRPVPSGSLSLFSIFTRSRF